MVGRHDTRLLENLVKSEKDYHASLLNLLTLSHSSVASLSAYGSSLIPSTSRAVMSVAGTLTAADDALAEYGRSIDDWREKLGEIRRLDSELETAMRDKEILITRLIKVSKQKPKNTPSNTSNTKLAIAQAELQACEIHLGQRQRELDEVVRSAVIDGLEKRCKALVECGNVWAGKGREGLVALEELVNTPIPNGDTHPYTGTAPRPTPFRMRHEANGSIDSSTSLAPSQSASQIGLGRPSEDTQLTAAGSNGQSLPHPRGIPPVPSPYRLDIPPAHSIDDHVLPSGMPAPALDEVDEIELNSSSEDEADRTLEVHDNPVRVPATFPVPMPPPSASILAKDVHVKTTAPTVPDLRAGPSTQPATTSQLRKPPTTGPTRRQSSEVSQQDQGKDRKRAPSFSLFGSIAGMFSTKSRSSAASGSKMSNGPPSPTKTRGSRLQDTPPLPKKGPAASGSGWQTRTDRNLREGASEMVVGNRPADSSSDEEDQKKKKGGLFSMRKNEKVTKARALDVVTNGPTPTTRARAGKQKSSDDTAVNEDSMASRRLSRHSSDGALRSRSNSLSRAAPTPRRSKDDTALNRKLSTKAAAPPPPIAKDPPPLQLPLPRATTISGGKIRKRAPAKHFDDGLGKSGGALLIGAAAANARTSASPTQASGNTALGGVARSNTIKSTSTTTAATSASRTNVNPPYRRGSLQSDGSMPAVAKSGETITRSSSMSSSNTGAGAGAVRRSNNLMSIVESRGGGDELSRLEVVKAPTSSAAAGPTLYLPSTGPPPPPPSSSRAGTRRASADGPASMGKLVLPSAIPKEEDRRVPNGFTNSVAAERKPHPGPTAAAGLVLPSSLSSTNLHSPPPIPHPITTTNTPPASGLGRNSSIRSNGTPSALMPPPLRSALRNRSPSPAPFAALPPVAAPAPPPVPTKSPKRMSPQQLQPPIHTVVVAADDGGDSASISSYETGHEMFGEESDAPTVQAEKRSPVPMPVPPAPAPVPSMGLLGFDPPPPPPPPPHDAEKRGTDLSFSTTETDSTSQPHRRKSVRMALPPSALSTPAVTPAAVEDNGSTWPQPQVHQDTSSRRSRNYAERDIWAEADSDEGGEYGEARKALAKATKAFASAGDLTKREKRSSHRA